MISINLEVIWAIYVKIGWWRKSEAELKAAYQELQRSRVGRRARIEGTVESIEEFVASVIQ